MASMKPFISIFLISSGTKWLLLRSPVLIRFQKKSSSSMYNALKNIRNVISETVFFNELESQKTPIKIYFSLVRTNDKNNLPVFLVMDGSVLKRHKFDCILFSMKSTTHLAQSELRLKAEVNAQT